MEALPMTYTTTHTAAHTIPQDPIHATQPMDTITINHLEITTIIGTYSFERRLKQKLFITAHFPVNASSISEHDDINVRSTVDYEKLSDAIVKFGLENNFFLLETFAEKLSKHLFNLYPIKALTLEITKPAALKNAQGVKITICRTCPRPA